MSETVDILAIIREINKPTYLSHLILEGHDQRDKINQLIFAEGYDATKVELKLTLNGIEFTSQTVESILSHWMDMIVEQAKDKIPALKQQTEYLQTKKGLKDEARRMAKKMCYEMAHKFDFNEWDDDDDED